MTILNAQLIFQGPSYVTLEYSNKLDEETHT